MHNFSQFLCPQSAVTLIMCVPSPLRQFDQWSLARFNQTVSKIGYTQKTVFYNLKSQGPLKHAKNIAEM